MSKYDEVRKQYNEVQTQREVHFKALGKTNGEKIVLREQLLDEICKKIGIVENDYVEDLVSKKWYVICGADLVKYPEAHWSVQYQVREVYKRTLLLKRGEAHWNFHYNGNENLRKLKIKITVE